MGSSCWILVAVIALAGFAESQSDANAPCEASLIATSDPQFASTPNYPGNYPNDVSCTWYIIASVPGGQVEVIFGHVETESCCDYVVVRDGSTSDSTLIANYRGTGGGGSNFLSTFGALYITFVSDESITRSGFEFQYREVEVESGCGDSLTATQTTQSVSSPNFPMEYPNDAFCIWTITAPDNMIIGMGLLLRSMEICCDNLLIRDGVVETSPLIAYINGHSTINSYYRSRSSSIQLRFRSNFNNTFVGFYLTYRAFKKVVGPITPPDIEECPTVPLTAPDTGHGSFTSPNYPNAHAGDLMCAWVITCPTGPVRVWFSYVNTETCCDWLIIRDGADDNSPKLDVISGNPTSFHSYVSTGNVLRVEFNTDSTINARGFTAFYEKHLPGGDHATSTCGGNLRADNTLRYFSTPNWPASYDSSTTCTWVISAGLDLNVQVHVLGIITENFIDEFRAYNGRSALFPRIITITGKHYRNFRITSHGPFMTIVFVSDSSINHGGFRATYTEVPAEMEDDE